MKWQLKILQAIISASLVYGLLYSGQTLAVQHVKGLVEEREKKEEKIPPNYFAVIIPELIEPHWHEYLLHNIHAAVLRTLLFMQRDQRTVVITTPWYLH